VTAAMIEAIAPSPTLRTAPSPKRMRVSPTTVNLYPTRSHPAPAPGGELARLVDVLHTDRCCRFRGQQRRHELGGIIGLEPRGLIRKDRIRDGVRLVEAVAAERLDLRGDLLDGALIVARAIARFTKLLSSS